MINPLPANEGTGVGIDFGYVTKYPGGYHSGIDMHAPRGNDVVAAEDGIVVYAQDSEGNYGYRVDIDHGNGLFTVYAHLDSIYVEVDQPVDAGDPLGGVGDTGNTSGVHLHFEVRVGENKKANAVDPMPYIKPTPKYYSGAWMRTK